MGRSERLPLLTNSDLETTNIRRQQRWSCCLVSPLMWLCILSISQQISKPRQRDVHMLLHQHTNQPSAISYSQYQAHSGNSHRPTGLPQMQWRRTRGHVLMAHYLDLYVARQAHKCQHHFYNHEPNWHTPKCLPRNKQHLGVDGFGLNQSLGVVEAMHIKPHKHASSWHRPRSQLRQMACGCAVEGVTATEQYKRSCW